MKKKYKVTPRAAPALPPRRSKVMTSPQELTYAVPKRTSIDTYIEVIKDITPTVVFRDAPNLQTPDQMETQRNSLSTISTSSQYASDSGYSTGQTSSTSNSLSVSTETPAQVDQSVITSEKKLAERPSLLAAHPIFEGIASLNRSRCSVLGQTEIGSRVVHAASPVSSPPTPRRFRSPECIRTRGMDFEEKWCYFETITSPPEEFKDRPDTMRIQSTDHRGTKTVDINGNLIINQKCQNEWDSLLTPADPAPCQPYRAIRRIHRNTQNAETNTTPNLVRKTTNCQEDSYFQSSTQAATSIEFITKSPIVRAKTHSQDIANPQKTSPVLKRLFSTSLARGIEVS